MDTHIWLPPSDSPQQHAIAHVAARSDGGPLDPTRRVTINFHPARLHRDVPLLHPLANDGAYRSQFETGTGNGSLSAFPGGERWHWEVAVRTERHPPQDLKKVWRYLARFGDQSPS